MDNIYSQTTLRGVSRAVVLISINQKSLVGSVEFKNLAF